MVLIAIMIIGLLLLLFLYSALVVSSRCSREEEKHEHIDN